MKIVYAINSIRGLGGIQKVTILKANALADISQNEVYIIVTDDWKNHPLMHILSPKVRFINLKINYYKSDYKSKIHQILSNFKMIKHYLRLQKVISDICPDVLISVGLCEKYIIPLLYTNAIKIREVHFNSNYRNYTYNSKLMASLFNTIDFKIMSKGYNRIVLLTKEDKDTFFANDSRYTYIHNPVTFNYSNDYNSDSNCVIAVGRLCVQKDFISLIKIWEIVHGKYPNWKLKIVGDGPEKGHLQGEIDRLNLSESVRLVGLSNNIKKEMSNASIFVLTSLYEGFGLVLLEAMACGLPIISFACQFGPKDIIKDGKNGVLIYNRDIEMFSKKLIYLIQNKNIRKEMSHQAQIRVQDFAIEEILKKWMLLFDSEIQNHRNKF